MVRGMERSATYFFISLPNFTSSVNEKSKD